ncbi:TIM21-domain-containing protein [Wallemia mellicola]|nr:TIM21-domain-containing protein [Wallemia mellicola]TIC49980.1 TIM21-domain-containing protein [Wallemia mellicola]
MSIFHYTICTFISSFPAMMSLASVPRYTSRIGQRTAWVLSRQFASKANDGGNTSVSSQDVDSASTRLKARQLLNQLEDSRNRGNSAGPFGAATISDDVNAAPEKTFSEQTTFKGKGGYQTNNWILLMKHITGLLVYTMGTELFSSNSPTRLYGKACKLISDSPDVRKLMGDSSLTFYSQAPDSRRRRNHQIQHMTAFDAYGKEHMIMKFYVNSKLPSTEETQSWEEWIESLTITDIGKKVKRGIQTMINPDLRYDQPEKAQNEQTERSNWFGALGSGINRLGRHKKANASTLYDSGQAYADLVKNEAGYFEWNLLYVDVPHSRTFNRKRVYVHPA